MFFNLFLLFFTLLTRFFKLDWGNGFYFHPDENNMATAISQFSPTNLDPNFYAYGQFPLYLSYFSLNILSLPNSFGNSIIILRLWSAVFSCLSIIIFYLISKKIFNQSFARVFSLLLIFNPGLIQLAHFGTTESLLIFVFAANIYLGLKIIEQPIFFYFLIGSIVTGIGLASKISSLIFITPFLISVFFVFLKTKKISILLFATFYLLFSISFSILFSPYNFINYPDFISALTYETKVATGQMRVFYTNQFSHSLPYIFQFTHIFPYVSGLPVFLFSFVGFFLFLKTYFLRPKILIIFLPCLIYFLYFGQVYTKWTRFMSPLFFVFPFLTTYFLISCRRFFLPLLFLCLIPGLFFFNLYLHPDIRLTVSSWISQKIPQNYIILSEAGNVVNLPILGHNEVINFDFYNLDTNPSLISKLPYQIYRSDYILIPSRRIFKNQSNFNFPISQKYYQSLFSGQLGFSKLKDFIVKNNFILNSENAEETWSVFDHPAIRIYQKVNRFDEIDYAAIFKT